MSLYLGRYRVNRRQWCAVTPAGEKIPLRVISFRMHWGIPMTRQDAVAEQARLFPDPEAHGPNQPGELLTTICLNVRASITGSCDPITDGRLREVRDMLDLRVKTWLPSGSTIDNAVNTMCRAVIGLIEQELESRSASTEASARAGQGD